MINKLPTEIIREIFIQLIIHCFHKPSRRSQRKRSCQCWQLDMLNLAMVCSRWSSIATLFLEQEDSWMSLLNHTDRQRVYPFRLRLIKILRESEQGNHFLHLRIRHLTIDFLSAEAYDKGIKRLSFPSAIEALRLCPNIEQVDILYDATFSSLSNNYLSSSLARLGRCMQYETRCRIKQLNLIGYNPLQRCACCAGKAWDFYLVPLFKRLCFVETLVLEHVLPSQQAFEALSVHPNLQRIVFKNAIVSLPTQRKRRTNYVKPKGTTLSQIPGPLWKQIKAIEIYQDTEDILHTHRYLLELAQHVYCLESFLLQFGTRKEPIKSFELSQTSPLQKLKLKCGESLKLISLVNVPEVLL